MTLLDTVVTSREALLSRILSFAGDSILNDAEPTGPPLAGSELASALKHGANALKAAAIDAQLDLAAASFVANDVAIDTRAGLVRLSSIFKWYAGDFGGRAGVIAFLKERLPEGEERDWLRRQGHHVKLIHRPYDWGLNSVR